MTTSCNDIVLPNAWELENESGYINIDGLKVCYTDPDDCKAAIIRANHPIPSQCGIFYFEIKIIDKGKNGIIGVGYCTKPSDKKIDKSNMKSNYINNMLMPGQIYKETEENKENKKNGPWGCGYHGDDGYFFCSGNSKPYGPSYTTGETIGCYLNFKKNIVFYTKNGVNLGIACYLPDDLEGILHPCIGLRSQGSSVEANFGDGKFEYSVMNNEDISNKLNNSPALEETLDKLTKSLEKNPNDLINLNYRGRIYLMIGKYEEALEDLTNLLKIEQDNIIALRYRGEINYLMKSYNESINDLNNLLKIKPNDACALKALELVEEAPRCRRDDLDRRLERAI